jgi:hypothetical protein
MKIEVLNKLLVRYIGKAYIIKINCSVDLFNNLSIFSIRNLWLFFNKFKYSGCTGKSVLKLCDNA